MNIIVTGASRGIGFEIAKQFAEIRENYIIAIARKTDSLQEISRTLPCGKNETCLLPLSCDLSKKGFELTIREFVLKRFTKIDILINNAGLLINKPIEEQTAADFDKMFNVNTKAPFLIVRELLPYFSKPSHIVNISSMGGFQGSEKFPGLSLYSASKGALTILTECMATELKDRNIFVNCLALGGVQTEMFAKAFPGYKAKTTPKEMAKYIVDFAMNGYKTNNGNIIPVTKETF